MQAIHHIGNIMALVFQNMLPIFIIGCLLIKVPKMADIRDLPLFLPSIVLSFLINWLISNPLQFIVGFATIKFVVEAFGEINGWNYGQLAFLYGISAISHALSMIFFVQGWFMGYYVIEGECADRRRRHHKTQKRSGA